MPQSSEWPEELAGLCLPGTTKHRALLFGGGAVTGQQGLGVQTQELPAAPSCCWGSKHSLAFPTDAHTIFLAHGSPGFSQLCFQRPAPFRVLPANRCQRAGCNPGHGRPWPRAARLPPASCLQHWHQGSCPSPSCCHHAGERLPAVTNPAESGHRLRCSQSPREIVPRASPQPRAALP